MRQATKITVYRQGRRPFRSTWRRTSSVADPDTILHRKDRIVETDTGKRWRVSSYRDGLVVLRAEL